MPVYDIVAPRNVTVFNQQTLLFFTLQIYNAVFLTRVILTSSFYLSYVLYIYNEQLLGKNVLKVKVQMI